MFTITGLILLMVIITNGSRKCPAVPGPDDLI